jgi:hypothetical protein
VTPCDQFRALLEAWLRAPGVCEARLLLEADSHPAACARCRALFEGEQALEHLLAEAETGAVPPPALARRVLARLQAARDVAPLGRALDHLRVDAVPPELARRLLAGLEPERRIEPWLARLPRPDAPPAGLAERVAAAVRSAALPAKPTAGPRRRRRMVLLPAALLAAAASAVLLLGPWRPAPPPDDETARVAEFGAALQSPPNELLAALDLLEDWELLVGESELALLLGGLDEFDLWLLESEADEAFAPPPARSEQG